MHNKHVVYINKIYTENDTAVFNGFYKGVPAIIKVVTNSPIYGIKHKVLREICSLKQIQHSNIVRLIDVMYITNDLTNSVIMIFEKGQTSLDNLQIQKLNSYETIKDITGGLKYIHKKGYIHGDIKMSNIIVHKTEKNEKIFKIIDFGNCTKVYRISAISMPTPEITPIEMLNFNQLSNPTAIDSWGLGCLTYNIVTGHPLFVKNNIEELKIEVSSNFMSNMKQIEGIKARMLKHIDANFTKSTTKLFNTNVKKRHSVLNFYRSVYKTNYEENLDEKEYDGHHEYFVENVVNNNDRKFTMDMLIGLNTENKLPIENVFITFQLLDNNVPLFDYKTDAIMLYSVVTKLICNSHFQLISILEILRKVSGTEIDITELNKKIGKLLEYYKWDLDQKTLISYLTEIDKKFVKRYIVMAICVLYSSRYVSISNSYKKDLILNILNVCFPIKCKFKHKMKFKNFYRDFGEMKNMMKTIKCVLDNGLIIGYISSVGLMEELRWLKIYLHNDISKFEINI